MRTRLSTPVTLLLLALSEGAAFGQPPGAAPPPQSPAPAPAPGSTAPGSTAAPGASALPHSEPVTKDGSVQLSGEDAALQARAEASASALPASETDAGPSTSVPVDPAQRRGFTSGLRVGFGVPLGKAGEDVAGVERELGDLTPWAAPVWVDVAYAFSGRASLGAYGQIGVGAAGDACQGDCDWSQLRVGAAAELRFAPGAPLDPWLGLGVGYEWLSYRTLAQVEVPDGEGGVAPVSVRATERFSGPELLLQGGLDFQVEDALRLGPYAALTAGAYVTDSYSCQPASDLCPTGSSVEGGAFHSWISVGLRGAYTP